jgi:hypothetical protein
MATARGFVPVGMMSGFLKVCARSVADESRQRGPRYLKRVRITHSSVV